MVCRTPAERHKTNLFLRLTEMPRIYDAIPPNLKLVPGGLPHDIDPPLIIPEVLPATTAPNTQERFTKTPIYDGLT